MPGGLGCGQICGVIPAVGTIQLGLASDPAGGRVLQTTDKSTVALPPFPKPICLCATQANRHSAGARLGWWEGPGSHSCGPPHPLPLVEHPLWGQHYPTVALVPTATPQLTELGTTKSQGSRDTGPFIGSQTPSSPLLGPGFLLKESGTCL